MSKIAVVAVGGNSLIKDSKHQEISDQYAAAAESARHVVGMIEQGWNVVVTHGPCGEYTRSLRSEETSQAVTDLWRSGVLTTRHLLLFAYEDAERTHLPRPRPDAHLRQPLPDRVRQAKQHLVRSLYSLEAESWLTRSVQPEEAFYHFDSPRACEQWLAAGR